MYNGNNEVVNSIIRRKTQLGLVRDHPDAPGDADMRMYHVPKSKHKVPLQFDLHKRFYNQQYPIIENIQVTLDICNVAETETADTISQSITADVAMGTEAS